MTTIKSNIWKLDSEKEGLDTLYRITTGTFKIASLKRVSYDDIVRVFGVPSINIPSGDDKVQVEWVFYFDGDNVFTIYDWKTFDRDYTLQELTTWSIGGHKKDYDFLETLEDYFKNKAIIL